MAISEMNYVEGGGGSNGRIKIYGTTEWNPYPSAKTFTIDTTHVYALIVTTISGCKIQNVVQDGILYEDVHVTGSSNVTVSLSGTTLSVGASSYSGGAELIEFEVVNS